MQNNLQPAVDVTVERAMLESDAGLSVSIVATGAAIQSIQVPAPEGVVEATLSYDDAGDYASDLYVLGATVGPYANRIRDARFRLGGREYAAEVSDDTGRHCLHSGESGFHRQQFELSPADDGRSVQCRYTKPDGQGGFPGNVEVLVIYRLLDDLTLAIDFDAVSDADTILSMTNHAYFNLDAAPDTTIDEHILVLYADRYTPVDDDGIPTGRIDLVAGSEVDFLKPNYLADPYTGVRRRLDTNFVAGGQTATPRKVATLQSQQSGLAMHVHTTQPGLQVYTGDKLGAPFKPRQGLCLEAQNFPDAPNQRGFPSPVVRAGQRYRQRTVYEFAWSADL